MTVEDLEAMVRQKELDEKVFCLQEKQIAFDAGLPNLPYNLLQPEADCMNNAYSLQKKAIYFLAVWFQTNWARSKKDFLKVVRQQAKAEMEVFDLLKRRCISDPLVYSNELKKTKKLLKKALIDAAMHLKEMEGSNLVPELSI
jgi:hypothetical protein